MSTNVASTTVARFRYHGTGGSLFGLVLVNGLLTIITLGIYSFWAKTKVRQFHYSHTELDGDRFAYHGTGGELLSGALKATGILMVLGLAFGLSMALLAGDQPSAEPPIVGIAVFYAAIGLLLVVAINGARKYRLSRSSWRGIRFSFHGQLGEFVGMMLKGTLLTIVTIGFYSPWFQSDRRAFFVNNARFGSEPFRYDGNGRDMFGQWIKTVLLTIPTLGLSWIWYAAWKHRYFWGHTTMRGGRFRSDVTGGELLGLTITNLLLVIVTLGIGAAWAIVRNHVFFAENMSLHGTMDWASIQQRAQRVGTTGEGLAEGLDVDVGIGM